MIRMEWVSNFLQIMGIHEVALPTFINQTTSSIIPEVKFWDIREETKRAPRILKCMQIVNENIYLDGESISYWSIPRILFPVFYTHFLFFFEKTLIFMNTQSSDSFKLI